MTKEQLNKKIDELMQQVSDSVKKSTNKAVSCGAVNMEDYGDDFELPKIVLAAALMQATYEFMPLTTAGKKEANNIYKMI